LVAVHNKDGFIKENADMSSEKKSTNLFDYNL